MALGVVAKWALYLYFLTTYILFITSGWVLAANYAKNSGLDPHSSFARAPLGFVYLVIQIPSHLWEQRSKPIGQVVDDYFNRCKEQYR